MGALTPSHQRSRVTIQCTKEPLFLSNPCLILAAEIEITASFSFEKEEREARTLVDFITVTRGQHSTVQWKGVFSSPDLIFVTSSTSSASVK